MKVAELKQVVDRNAEETRAEFEKVRAEFADVRHEMRSEFADVRKEMRDGFTAVNGRIDGLERRMDEHAAEAQRRLEIVMDNFADKIALVVESGLEEKVDLKLAKFQVRMERMFEPKKR